MSEVYERRIDLGDGSGVQVFTSDTQEGLIDKLAMAQEHATRKIREQSRQIKTGLGLITPDPDEPVPQYKPRKLSADEQFRLTQDLSDPAKAPEAIRAMMEAEIGAPLEEVRNGLTTLEIQRRANRANQESVEFVKEHPEYYPSQGNSDAIFGYLEKNKMAVTKKNVALAYQDLSDSGLLETRPEPKKEEQPEPERIARPRTSSLRPGASSSGGVPTAKPAITWAEIDKMPPATYDERMRDAAFRKAVDALPRR